MSEMIDYKSRLSDPASRKFETFSYLPAMDKEQIKKQVQYIVSKGWNPAVEHTEPEYLMISSLVYLFSKLTATDHSFNF